MSGREEIQNFKTYLLAKEKLNQVDYQEVVSNLRSTNFIKDEADKIYQPRLLMQKIKQLQFSVAFLFQTDIYLIKFVNYQRN